MSPRETIAAVFDGKTDAECADLLEAVGDYFNGYRADDALETAVADLRWDGRSAYGMTGEAS